MGTELVRQVLRAEIAMELYCEEDARMHQMFSQGLLDRNLSTWYVHVASYI